MRTMKLYKNKGCLLCENTDVYTFGSPEVTAKESEEMEYVLPYDWQCGETKEQSQSVIAPWGQEYVLNADDFATKAEVYLIGVDDQKRPFQIPIRYGMDTFRHNLTNHIKEYLPVQYANHNPMVFQADNPMPDKDPILVIMGPNTRKARAINIKKDFEAYKSGTGMDDIMKHIAKKYLNTQIISREGEENYMRWQEMKDRIYVEAVGTTKETALLDKVPHQSMGDITAVYHIYMTSTKGGRISILINNEMLDRMNVSKEELHETAVKNSVKAMPLYCSPMEQTLADITGMTAAEESLPPLPFPLYIVSNQDANYGAAVVFYPNVFKPFEEMMPEGFYILPSSLHEVMVVPKGVRSIAELNEMVTSINEEEVAPEDVLSNQVHEYDPITRKLVVAGEKKPELEKSMCAAKPAYAI